MAAWVLLVLVLLLLLVLARWAFPPRRDTDGPWAVRHERIRAGTASYADHGPFRTKARAARFARAVVGPYDAAWIVDTRTLPRGRMPPLPAPVEASLGLLAQDGLPCGREA